MSKLLRDIHSPVERANMTACTLGIHLKYAHESFGGTDSIRAMKEGRIIFHSTTQDTVSFLCGLHKKVNSLLALFSAENINHQDKESCTKSIIETCASKKNLEIYNDWIYGNESLIKALSK